jgi:hypothetical protein
VESYIALTIVDPLFYGNAHEDQLPVLASFISYYFPSRALQIFVILSFHSVRLDGEKWLGYALILLNEKCKMMKKKGERKGIRNRDWKQGEENIMILLLRVLRIFISPIPRRIFSIPRRQRRDKIFTSARELRVGTQKVQCEVRGVRSESKFIWSCERSGEGIM